MTLPTSHSWSVVQLGGRVSKLESRLIHQVGALFVPSGSSSLFWLSTHQVLRGHLGSPGPLVFGCSPGSHHMSLLRLLVSEGGPWSILTLIHSRLNPQVRASLSRPKGPAYHGLDFQFCPVPPGTCLPITAGTLGVGASQATAFSQRTVVEWTIASFPGHHNGAPCFSPSGMVVKSSWGQLLWLRTLDGIYLGQIFYLL